MNVSLFGTDDIVDWKNYLYTVARLSFKPILNDSNFKLEKYIDMFNAESFFRHSFNNTTFLVIMSNRFCVHGIGKNDATPLPRVVAVCKVQKHALLIHIALTKREPDQLR